MSETHTYRQWWATLDRPEYVVQSVRSRRPFKPDPDMLPGDKPIVVNGSGPPEGFYSFFLDDDECAVALPLEVINDGMSAMYEAMREEGMRSLEEFARQLVPIVRAIEAFAGAEVPDGE